MFMFTRLGANSIRKNYAGRKEELGKICYVTSVRMVRDGAKQGMQ